MKTSTSARSSKRDNLAIWLFAGTGFRLRSRLLEGDALLQAEAVFSPKGKLEHLADPTTTKPATPLNAVARRLLGRRIRMEGPERALELWRALVSGRWSSWTT